MRDLRNRRNILNHPKEIRRLHQHTSGLLADSPLQRNQIDATVLAVADLLRRMARAGFAMLRVGAHHLAILRVHRARNHHPIASRHAHRHHRGLRRCGRSVVHRRVRDIHARQLADHRLEFKDGLQGPLRDLRLIGRVRGEKLAALYDGVDQHGPVVPVNARAQKTRVAVGVLRRRGFEVIDDFRFAHLARNHKVARQPIFLRNDGKEIVDR